MESERFIYQIEWELSYFFRFPLPEVVIGALTLLGLLNFLSGYAAGASFFQELNWDIATFASKSTLESAADSLAFFEVVSLFCSVIPPLSFVRGFETREIMDILSLPLSREEIFTAKFLSSLIFISVSMLLSSIIASVVISPDLSLRIFTSVDIIVLYLRLVLYLLFLLSLSIMISVISNSSLLSAMGSFLIILAADTISKVLHIPFPSYLGFMESLKEMRPYVGISLIPLRVLWILL